MTFKSRATPVPRSQPPATCLASFQPLILRARPVQTSAQPGTIRAQLSPLVQRELSDPACRIALVLLVPPVSTRRESDAGVPPAEGGDVKLQPSGSLLDYAACGYPTAISGNPQGKQIGIRGLVKRGYEPAKTQLA